MCLCRHVFKRGSCKTLWKEEYAVYIICINSSPGGKPGQEKEWTSQQIEFGTDQDRQLWAGASTVSLCLTSCTRVWGLYSEFGRMWCGMALFLFSAAFLHVPENFKRTSKQLHFHWNVQRDQVFHLFIFSFCLCSHDSSNPSIRSEGGGLMTLCII